MFSFGVMLHFMMLQKYPECNEKYLSSIEEDFERFEEEEVNFYRPDPKTIRSSSVDKHVFFKDSLNTGVF